MKNENFMLQSSLEGNYLNVNLQEPIQLDEIAVRVVKQDCPEFLIPFRIVERNDSMYLRFKLMDMVALEYANMKLHKTEFMKLYQNLLLPFIKGNDWFLNYHNLCIDPQYIFLDRMSENAYFIYIPEQKYQHTDDEILQFFKDTFIHITIMDDTSFQVRLFQYFARQDVTLTDLYKLLQEEDKKTGDVEKICEAGEAVVPVDHKQLEKVQNITASVQKQSMHPVALPETEYATSGSSDESDEVMRVLFGDDKKKDKDKNKKKEKNVEKKVEKSVREEKEKKKAGGLALFSRKKGQTVLAERSGQSTPNEQSPAFSGGQQWQAANMSGTFSAVPYDMDDKTEISSDGAPMSAYLELIDSPLPGALTRIQLNFKTTYITIGRASSDEIQPDVAFRKEFTRISRRHARIENREGSYFVIDLGSANHTLLNGQILVPNQPYELQDGVELAFSDNKSLRYRVHL